MAGSQSPGKNDFKYTLRASLLFCIFSAFICVNFNLRESALKVFSMLVVGDTELEIDLEQEKF